ncbi:hypothetical protein [Yoonia sp. 208BN28-4]|uniref:hypothetical protein n=1 Tax=Yoonia sp. 208BN28-4 TaxID=3126505 RepID=UPI0030A27FDC
MIRLIAICVALFPMGAAAQTLTDHLNRCLSEVALFDGFVQQFGSDGALPDDSFFVVPEAGANEVGLTYLPADTANGIMNRAECYVVAMASDEATFDEIYAFRDVLFETYGPAKPISPGETQKLVEAYCLNSGVPVIFSFGQPTGRGPYEAIFFVGDAGEDHEC